MKRAFMQLYVSGLYSWKAWKRAAGYISCVNGIWQHSWSTSRCTWFTNCVVVHRRFSILVPRSESTTTSRPIRTKETQRSLLYKQLCSLPRSWAPVWKGTCADMCLLEPLYHKVILASTHKLQIILHTEFVHLQIIALVSSAETLSISVRRNTNSIATGAAVIEETTVCGTNDKKICSLCTIVQLCKYMPFLENKHNDLLQTTETPRTEAKRQHTVTTEDVSQWKDTKFSKHLFLCANLFTSVICTIVVHNSYH